MVLAAVAMPLMIGGLALAIDTGYLYLCQRQLQQQADTAAVGAATAKSKGTSSLATLRTLATRDAVRNGYVDAASNSIAVNIPPTSGSHTGDTTAVEVIVQARVKTFFSQYFNLASSDLRARAVAGFGGEGTAGGGGCVLALHTTASQALRFQGSGSITAPSCTVLSNSNAPDSVFIGGSETLTALTVYAAGGMELGPSATVNLTTDALTYKSPVTDPYAGLTVPVTSGCTYTNYSVSNSKDKTTYAGTYCNGFSVSGSGMLYMGKGTYIIKGGDFKIGGTSTVRCLDCYATTDGITIILTAGSDGNIGTISIAGTTDVQFSAPTSTAAGAWRGIAIYQDRNATVGNAANLTGSSNMKISGAIYLPVAQINYSGTSDLPAGKRCVEIIGLIVEVQGNSRLTLQDCPTMGVQAIEASGGTLHMLE